MLFNSFIFIVFFISVTSLYYLSPHKFRWLILLVSSLIFYGVWKPSLLLLLLLSISVNYIFSAQIFLSGSAKTRKRLLIFGQIFNFGLLFVFKYFMYFASGLSGFFSNIGFNTGSLTFDIVLPMGISFYTFQSSGYMFDIYHRRIGMERNLLRFTLFITFFPQLVAGPIERASCLLPQIFTKKEFSVNNLILGLKYMAFGFFKKIVIADRLSMAVNTVYNSPQHFSGPSLAIATFFFAFQIYCDFSGYSDIAIGCSKILGIELTQNFKQPYLSASVREFWRRWHISLSGWFKDYLYIPLGGNRVATQRYYMNIFITFLLSGLWHGANLTFVLWGAIHGAYQVLENIIDSVVGMFSNTSSRDKKQAVAFRFLGTCLTFFLIYYTWIFFRANNVSDALYIAGNIFSDWHIWTNPQQVFEMFNSFGMTFVEVIIGFLLILFLAATEALGDKENIHVYLSKRGTAVNFIFYFIITAAILSLGVFYNAGEFIYFQF